MDNLDQQLVGCFKVIFPDLDEKQIRLANKNSVVTWDSVAAVTLVNVVEDEFGTQIDPDDAPDLTSFERFLDYMRARK